MPTSKQNISKPKIEKEIYNTFKQFKKENNIKIVNYLNNFNVNLLKNREYRYIEYSYESLLRFLLFQKLKGIRFQTELVGYLKTHPKEKHGLLGKKQGGFSRKKSNSKDDFSSGSDGFLGRFLHSEVLLR